MGLPDFPRVQKPIKPLDFQCECVCVEVQKILDGRKQKECQVFVSNVNFALVGLTLPLVDEDQNPLLIVNWLPGDDISCAGAVFKQNRKTQIFVIEKPPQDFTVTPLPDTDPPAAEITVVVTPGTDPTPINTCRVKDTILVELVNNTPLRIPTRGFLEVCPILFVKDLIMFWPDPEQIGLVSVKTESSWEIIDCTVQQFLNVLRVEVSVGAFIIVKTWAEAQLVMTSYGECDWELIPPLEDNACAGFIQRQFPPFNPAQLQDFFRPPSA
ncbi:MAG: hypothetical protein AB1576_10675 [Bacillota bacterium]|jgi:hypothetical protein